MALLHEKTNGEDLAPSSSETGPAKFESSAGDCSIPISMDNNHMLNKLPQQQQQQQPQKRKISSSGRVSRFVVTDAPDEPAFIQHSPPKVSGKGMHDQKPTPSRRKGKTQRKGRFIITDLDPESSPELKRASSPRSSSPQGRRSRMIAITIDSSTSTGTTPSEMTPSSLSVSIKPPIGKGLVSRIQSSSSSTTTKTTEDIMLASALSASSSVMDGKKNKKKSHLKINTAEDDMLLSNEGSTVTAESVDNNHTQQPATVYQHSRGEMEHHHHNSQSPQTDSVTNVSVKPKKIDASIMEKMIETLVMEQQKTKQALELILNANNSQTSSLSTTTATDVFEPHYVSAVSTPLETLSSRSSTPPPELMSSSSSSQGIRHYLPKAKNDDIQHIFRELYQRLEQSAAHNKHLGDEKIRIEAQLDHEKRANVELRHQMEILTQYTESLLQENENLSSADFARPVTLSTGIPDIRNGPPASFLAQEKKPTPSQQQVSDEQVPPQLQGNVPRIPMPRSITPDIRDGPPASFFAEQNLDTENNIHKARAASVGSDSSLSMSHPQQQQQQRVGRPIVNVVSSIGRLESTITTTKAPPTPLDQMLISQAVNLAERLHYDSPITSSGAPISTAKKGSSTVGGSIQLPRFNSDASIGSNSSEISNIHLYPSASSSSSSPPPTQQSSTSSNNNLHSLRSSPEKPSSSVPLSSPPSHNIEPATNNNPMMDLSDMFHNSNNNSQHHASVTHHQQPHYPQHQNPHNSGNQQYPLAQQNQGQFHHYQQHKLPFMMMPSSLGGPPLVATPPSSMSYTNRSSSHAHPHCQGGIQNSVNHHAHHQTASTTSSVSGYANTDGLSSSSSIVR